MDIFATSFLDIEYTWFLVASVSDTDKIDLRSKNTC